MRNVNSEEVEIQWEDFVLGLKSSVPDRPLWTRFVNDTYPDILRLLKGRFKTTGELALPPGWHENIADEVWAKVYQTRLAGFSWDKASPGSKRKRAAIISYLTSAVFNLARKEVEKLNRERPDMALVQEIPDGSVDEDDATRNEMHRIILKAIGELSEGERALLEEVVLPEMLEIGTERMGVRLVDRGQAPFDPSKDTQKSRLEAIALRFNRNLKGDDLQREVDKYKHRLHKIFKTLQLKLRDYYGFDQGVLTYKADPESGTLEAPEAVVGALLAWAKAWRPSGSTLRFIFKR